MGAGQQVREHLAAPPGAPPPRAKSPVTEIYTWSRAAIWAAAIFAFLVFEPNRHPRAAVWDRPWIHDLGYGLDVWARWDSVWFIRIAEHGYGVAKGAASAFYPLYPALLWVVGHVFGGHYVVAGVLISLAAAYVSFRLLYSLAEVRLGADGARRAVLYLAVFPMALFLQAVYSESLFLMLVLAAFFFAEKRRWLPAWTMAGLAILARVSGVALLPALALLAWRTPERKRALAGLAVPAAIFAIYPLYLGLSTGDAWGFARAQELWHRHVSPAGPFGGIWNGARAAWAGLEQIVSGSHTHRYWTAVPDRNIDPFHVAAVNLENFAFLILFVVLTVVVWRRLGAAYGLFATISLAIPLSVPSTRWPLLSLPRFGLVVFPFFLALAAIGGRPRVHTAIVAVSAMLLGVVIVQWALWQWVA